LRQVPISWRGRRGVTGLTLALSHSATQRRGWTPPGSRWNSRDAIPGRVRVVACVLRCHGIKCPYGGRGADDVHAGAFERDGPRRGGVEPSSEADLARGGVSPRVRWTPPEGALTFERSGPHSRGCLGLERGGTRPRERRGLERGGLCSWEHLTLEQGEPRPRGHSSCHPGGPRGPPGS
jgi:hypothetical protein